MTSATFAIESLIGSLPPKDAKTFYMARVDPHLTFGAEIALDVDETQLQRLKSVQMRFIH